MLFAVVCIFQQINDLDISVSCFILFASEKAAGLFRKALYGMRQNLFIFF